MDKTLIAFSARAGESIVVEGTAQEIDQKLGVGSVTGRIMLTQVPVENQRFDPAPVFVNPQRVAYVKPVASGG